MKNHNEFYFYIRKKLFDFLKEYYKKSDISILIEPIKEPIYPFIIIFERQNRIENETLHYSEQIRRFIFDIEIYTKDIKVGNKIINKTILNKEISSIVQNFMEQHRINIIINDYVPSNEIEISRKLIRCSCVVDETRKTIRKG